MKSNKIISLSAIALLALAPFSQAGKIGPLQDQAAPSHSSGFKGWNLDNVKVDITDLDFDETGYADSFVESTGYYDEMFVGDSFESDIFDTVNPATLLVNLHGKNWPVGEPSGIKVIEGPAFDATFPNGKPKSCIMTTSYLEGAYLDAATPSETLCGSDFQTHKRFKLNMLPSMVGADGAYGTGVNLTFNVYDDGNGETWRYQVLQKINNYTDKRLSGFKIEVGFLDGAGVFTTASANGADLRLSTDIFDADQIATFSHGLFGPQTFEEPVPHFPTDGFFDNTGAGFTVALNTPDDNDTLASTGAFVDSNYAALPVPYGAVASQFGDWLPSIWAPSGIFWDDDNDPTTDAHLVAFWGDRGDGTYTWMKGDRDNFQEVTAVDLATWAKSPVHAISEIEDVLNLGLNYIVEVGDVTTFPVTTPANTFTVRITPFAAADQTQPGYVTNAQPPLSDYIDEEGTLSITPAPTFTIAETLTLVVADSGLNMDTGAVETVDINVTTSLGEYEVITLTEIGVNRGVFTAELNTTSGTVAGTDSDGSINVAAGTVVTANYLDADNGSASAAVVTATTAAAIVAPPSSDSGSSFAVNDKVSLLFTIFGFLVIGGLIARRKLA